MSDDSEVLISAWVKIGDTSRIEYEVYRDGQVEFTIGDCDRFLLVTSKYGLQNFVAHANEALRTVRELVAHSNEGYAPAPASDRTTDLAVAAWRSTAEVWSDPNLARRLRGPLDGDGPVIERPYDHSA